MLRVFLPGIALLALILAGVGHAGPGPQGVYAGFVVQGGRGNDGFVYVSPVGPAYTRGGVVVYRGVTVELRVPVGIVYVTNATWFYNLADTSIEVVISVRSVRGGPGVNLTLVLTGDTTAVIPVKPGAVVKVWVPGHGRVAINFLVKSSTTTPHTFELALTTLTP